MRSSSTRNGRLPCIDSTHKPTVLFCQQAGIRCGVIIVRHEALQYFSESGAGDWAHQTLQVYTRQGQSVMMQSCPSTLRSLPGLLPAKAGIVLIRLGLHWALLSSCPLLNDHLIRSGCLATLAGQPAPVLFGEGVHIRAGCASSACRVVRSGLEVRC